MALRYAPSSEIPILRWTEYGGLEFPRYLITMASFSAKADKVRGIIGQVTKDMAEGVSNIDAGDAHGQFHNEIQWYREQQHWMRAKFAGSMNEGLMNAVVIPNYDIARVEITNLGLDPQKTVTLTTRVRLNIEGDLENLMIVSENDGNAQPHWLSVSSPLAKAIAGLMPGKEVNYMAGRHTNRVKILEII